MGLFFAHGYMDVAAIVLSIIICVFTYFEWAFTYWEKRKMPSIKPSFPWGTLSSPIANTKGFGDVMLHQYQESKQKGYTKIVGLYALSRPICMVVDPLLIKQIIATDFKCFMNRAAYYNEKDDPLGAHLFALEGVKWRNLRIKLTPTFTSGKMKMMFGILRECGNQLIEAVNHTCQKNEPVDIKNFLQRFTTNIIGSAAFGLECNAFATAESDFIKYGKRLFVSSKKRMLLAFFSFLNEDLARRLGVCSVDPCAADFFSKVIKETVEYREKNNIERNDFLQLLIHLKNGTHHEHGDDDEEQSTYKHDGKSITLDELSAQAFVFFIAGFETSSTTMTFCLFELAVNPDIQNKMRDEIVEVMKKHDGKITYDAIHDMKYMGQVVDETLRKYPPVPVLVRKCGEDYKVQDSDIVIEEGTPVFIPIVGIQHDPEYFPNPEKFDPDRFSDENKQDILPYTYMPFGEGPRICIGLRFGIMQTKVGLAVLLQNFKFSLNEKTKVPLQFEPSSFILSIKGDMWLNVEKI